MTEKKNMGPVETWCAENSDELSELKLGLVQLWGQCKLRMRWYVFGLVTGYLLMGGWWVA